MHCSVLRSFLFFFLPSLLCLGWGREGLQKYNNKKRAFESGDDLDEHHSMIAFLGGRGSHLASGCLVHRTHKPGRAFWAKESNGWLLFFLLLMIFGIIVKNDELFPPTLHDILLSGSDRVLSNQTIKVGDLYSLPGEEGSCPFLLLLACLLACERVCL